MAVTPNTLRGGPRIDGITYPLPHDETPLEGFVVDLTRTKEMADGSVRIVASERKGRLRWSFGWQQLDAATYAGLYASLVKPSFSFEPRTVSTAWGDDAGATVPSYTVYCTNIEDLPLATAVKYGNQFDVEVELETTTAITL